MELEKQRQRVEDGEMGGETDKRVWLGMIG